MALTKLPKNAIGTGAVKSNNIADGTIQNQDVSGSISNDKLANSSFTINGTSVSLGASQSIIPYLDWQAVQVADGSTQVNAEVNKGYFLDTNAGVIEVFLPTSPSRGDVVGLVDYAGTFGTNQLIINTGGINIDSTVGSEFKVTTNNAIVECVYVDSAKGWLVYINQAAGTTPTVTGNEIGGGYDTKTFIAATGGTITTSGDYKIHTFTGDGCFVSAPSYSAGQNGGSGGGGGAPNLPAGNAGLGNTPPTSPPQGTPGAGQGPAGNTLAIQEVEVVEEQLKRVKLATPPVAANGGDGATTSISGSSTSYAGGGGSAAGSSGGLGGGGGGGPSPVAGTTNTGGGGGGGGSYASSTGSSGGKGIVIIRYKFQ
jgi:hypothetical protein